MTVGACESLGLRKRELLWQLGLIIPARSHRDGGVVAGRQQPLALPIEQDMVHLSEPTAWEQLRADYGLLRLSPEHHPMALLRPHLGEGYPTSTLVARLRDGQALTVTGMVVCRQRPSTAKGFTFISLEDEHGLLNVIVRPPLYEKRRTAIRTAPFLVVTGTLQQKDGTTNLIARDVWELPVPATLLPPAAKNWG